jgi:hypothetical protein
MAVGEGGGESVAEAAAAVTGRARSFPAAIEVGGSKEREDRTGGRIIEPEH